MTYTKELLFSLSLLCSICCFSQAPVVKETAISRTSFYQNGVEELYAIDNGGVYYIICDDLGYYIEKFDEGMNSKKTVSKDLSLGTIENTFTKSLMFNRELFIITGQYNKKLNETDIHISLINLETLELINEKSLFKVMDRVLGVGLYKSEMENYLSVTRFIFDQKKAEFAIALFDSKLEMIYNKHFTTEFENYAMSKMNIETGDEGNVYIESLVYTQRVINPEKEEYKIFCISDFGNKMTLVEFPEYQFAAKIDAQPEGRLFAYMVTSNGMETFLIDGATGKILKNQIVNINVDDWKESAWYSDKKNKPLGMHFLPKLVDHDSEGNVYVVGEQTISGDAGGYFEDHYSILVIKFDASNQQQWYKIIPKLQSSITMQSDINSVQGNLKNDTLDLFINYSVEALKLDIFKDGDATRSDLNSVREAGNSNFTNDMVQIRILADGKISYHKIADNTRKAYNYSPNAKMEGQSFKIGSVEGSSANYYYLNYSNYSFKAGMHIGKKSVCHVKW